MNQVDKAIVYLWTAKIETMIARACTEVDFENCQKAINALGKFVKDNAVQ